jgi:hypothetical protein
VLRRCLVSIKYVQDGHECKMTRLQGAHLQRATLAMNDSDWLAPRAFWTPAWKGRGGGQLTDRRAKVLMSGGLARGGRVPCIGLAGVSDA